MDQVSFPPVGQQVAEAPLLYTHTHTLARSLSFSFSVSLALSPFLSLSHTRSLSCTLSTQHTADGPSSLAGASGQVADARQAHGGAINVKRGQRALEYHTHAPVGTPARNNRIMPRPACRSLYKNRLEKSGGAVRCGRRAQVCQIGLFGPKRSIHMKKDCEERPNDALSSTSATAQRRRRR